MRALLLALCACSTTPDLVVGREPRECTTESDCIQAGSCTLAPPRCEPIHSYEQVHCGPEDEEELAQLRMPAFYCECRAGRCQVGRVDQPTQHETPWPE